MNGYVITNGKKYLSHPVYDELTEDIEQAFLWKTVEKASGKAKFMNQKKVFGETVFKPVWVEREEAQIAAAPESETEEETEAPVPTGKEAYDLLSAFVPGIANRLGLLQKEEIQINQEFTDYMHFIEFSSLNAANGFAVMKELKDLRLRRREIKDEILYLQRLSSIFTEDAQIVLKELEKETVDRVYYPRVRPDLFDGSWMEAHKAKRKAKPAPEAEEPAAEQECGFDHEIDAWKNYEEASDDYEEAPDDLEQAVIRAALAGIDRLCS